MFNCYIVRYHEIALKGNNRDFFERKLVNNIRICLDKNKISYDSIKSPRGRIIIYTKEDCSLIKTIFGISNFSRAIEVAPQLDKLKKLALELYTKGSFRISTQRSDKTFPLTSQQINEYIGQYIVEKTGAEVNLKKPYLDIGIEIANRKAYIFKKKNDGPGGLPVGTAGKVAVLMEDEKCIISAYLMLKRGCSVVFVKKKKVDISILEKYSYGANLKINKNILKDVKALIVNDTINKINKYNTNLLILRPLAILTERDIKRYIKRIKSSTTSKLLH